jgi:hypothetical protein
MKQRFTVTASSAYYTPQWLRLEAGPFLHLTDLEEAEISQYPVNILTPE